jgi:hypothetical protein
MNHINLDLETHKKLISLDGNYAKMFRMGLCVIEEIQDNHFKIMLENPNIPMRKFIDSINSVWPEISISYIDEGFPYVIDIIDGRFIEYEYSRDFRTSSVFKFTYEGDKEIENFIEDCILEWINLISNDFFLKISRVDHPNPKIPVKWPHDIDSYKVIRTIRSVMYDTFLKMDWNTFNESREYYLSLILEKNFKVHKYLEREILMKICEFNIVIGQMIKNLE